MGRKIALKLKEVIDRQNFEIIIQVRGILRPTVYLSHQARLGKDEWPLGGLLLLPILLLFISMVAYPPLLPR